MVQSNPKTCKHKHKNMGRNWWFSANCPVYISIAWHANGLSHGALFIAIQMNELFLVYAPTFYFCDS